ncbi:MAG: EFR1 family ferrodoxin [Candidatus Omnitrophota bacterium]
MKTTLFYFSGTGNSLAVAQDIAREIGDAHIFAVPYGLMKPEVAAHAEAIGIVFPVYAWGLPLIVSEFLKKVKCGKDAYVFAVATYGGMPGAALKQAERELKERGVRLAAGFGVLMPGNYTPMYGAIAASRQEMIFKRAAEKIKRIAVVVNAGSTARIEGSPFLVNVLLSRVVYRMFISKVHEADTSFWVDHRCSGCGLCAKVCPVKNIAMAGGTPVWQHKCEQCMACLQWCPTQALQYGRSTVGRKRYHHPRVTAQDLMA